MRTLRDVALVWLLGAVALISSASATSGVLHLDDDVERLDLSNAAPKGSQKAAISVADIDNISVLTLDGDYARGNPQPRLDVARTFHQRHADAFDFLVVFTSFEFPTGEALAFYNPVFNDVQGIGLEPFDHRAAYGGAQRLQGYIDMAAMSRYEFNSRSPEYRSPLDTLTHESCTAGRCSCATAMRAGSCETI